ncbi:unnamed protein product [Prorocentrum cordatum]|uniref:Uncharacterized protein n=1 Tax=Prorocentrum cordatum TaxID=2364126 RepID=A0ABN9R5R9_9DINO|nr:unnamed protein product [Polarella glacialis]
MYLDVVRPGDVPRGAVQYPKAFDRALAADDIPRAVPTLAHAAVGSCMPVPFNKLHPAERAEVEGSRPREHYPELRRARDLSLNVRDIEGAQPKKMGHYVRYNRRGEEINPVQPYYATLPSENAAALEPPAPASGRLCSMDASDVAGARPAPALPPRAAVTDVMRCEAEFRSKARAAAMRVEAGCEPPPGASLHSLQRPATPGRAARPGGRNPQEPTYSVALPAGGKESTSLACTFSEEDSETPAMAYQLLGLVEGSQPRQRARNLTKPMFGLEVRDIEGAQAIRRVGTQPMSIYGPESNKEKSRSLATTDIPGAQAGTLKRGPQAWLSDEAFSPLSLPTPVLEEAGSPARAGEDGCSQEDWLEAAEEPPAEGGGQLVALEPLAAVLPPEQLPVAAPPLEQQKAATIDQTDAIGKVASVMVRRVYPDTQQPIGLESATRLAERLGIFASRLREKVYAVGHAAWRTGQRHAAAIVPRLLAVCRASRGPEAAGGPPTDAVIFFRKRKYDGTRIRVTTQVAQHYDADTIVERCAGTRELFVIKAGFSVVLRKRFADSDDFVHIIGSTPTHINVLETPSAEIINACLRRQLDQSYDKLANERIPRQVDVIGCDAAGSNLKNERIMAAQHPLRAQIIVLCRAHSKKKVAEQGYSVLRPTDSNMIRCQLSLSSEHLIAVRHNARLLRDEQVVVHVGSCSAEATAHRERVFDLYFSDTADASLQSRAAVCRRLYNGDIRKTGVIEHYCKGCCQSRDHTVFLMRRYGVAALFGPVDVLNRSNWTSKMKSHRCIGLPAAVHGLLQAAFLRGVPEPPQAKRRREQALQARAQAEALAAAGHEGGPEPLGPLQGPGRDPDADGDGADEVSAWREEQDVRIVSTRSWMSSGRVADDMYIASRMVSLTDAYLLKQLATSGVSVERLQQLKVSRGEARTYQAWLAHEDADARSLFKDVLDAIFDSSIWASVQHRSEGAALTIYRLMSRMGASAYHLVFRKNLCWPMKLFSALRDPEILNELGRTEPCLLDSYTENFLNFYGDAAGSATAMAELKGALVLIDTDTADVERLHSVNQRHARFRVWTHVETVEEMSAHFAAHSAGDMGPAPTRHDRGRASCKPEAPRPRRRPERGRCGLRFWMWRSFVHVNVAACLRLGSRHLSKNGLETMLFLMRAAASSLHSQRRPQLVSDDTVLAISADDKTSTAQMASAWEAMHQTLTADSCLPCDPKIPIVRRKCYEAEMCIHKGDGLELAKFEAHIRSAFTRWRHDDRKQTKAMLTKGEVVLRFTFVTVRAPIEDLPDVELFSDGPLPAAGVDHAQAVGVEAADASLLADPGGRAREAFCRPTYAFEPIGFAIEFGVVEFDVAELFFELGLRGRRLEAAIESAIGVAFGGDDGPPVQPSADPPPPDGLPAVGDDAAPPPDPVAPALVPRGVGKIPAALVWRYKSGVIRYYDTTKVMVAQCFVPSHQVEPGCYLARSVRPSVASKAKGRCLGLLCSWLEVVEAHAITRWDHVHSWKPPWEDRRRARREAMGLGLDLVAAFASKERDGNDGDRDGEPVGFP